jgi:hypothetical protein
MRTFLFCAIAVFVGPVLQAQIIAGGTKFRKNQFEIGTQAVNFLEGSGFCFPEAKSGSYEASRVSVFGFSYGRFVHGRWMLKARYHVFKGHYRGPYSDSEMGVLTVDRWSQNISASAAYMLRSMSTGNFQFRILISGDIHYRYISENVFADAEQGVWTCIPRNDWYSNYDMGMGSTVHGNIIYRNRLTLGADLGYGFYGHLSEQITTTERRTFKEIKPNRQTATLGIRLGMLF